MKRMLTKGSFLKGVVYKTPNVIIQEVKKDDNFNKCVVIGNGHSLSVDKNNRVIFHDPGMHEFQSSSINYTTYAFYFTFDSSGLSESGKEIAKFINDLPKWYEQVILVGHSKCGLCLTNIKHIVTRPNFLVTISSPFLGTIVADKEECEKRLKYSLFIKVYNMIFSDHNVDKDIAPNSEFINKMNRNNVDLNITSSVKRIRECTNALDLFLLFFDKFLKINGDGVVSIQSQEDCNSSKMIQISSSHATSLEKGLQHIK